MTRPPVRPEPERTPAHEFAEIERKVRGARFVRNERHQLGWWATRGAVAGAAFGCLLAVSTALIDLFTSGRNSAPPSPFRPEDWIPIAVSLVLLSALGGAFLASLFAVTVAFFKPIVAAIFWDAERYEREHGSGRAPPRNPSKLPNDP